jgi:hypothetical protein
VANKTRCPWCAAVDAERGGEVGFAGAGRAEEHDVAGLGQERPGGERGDLLADGGLVVPVEVVEGFAGREPGPADALGGAGGVAGGDFAFEHGGEVVLVCPAGVAGLVGEPGGGFGDPWCLQRGGEEVDLLDRVRRCGLLFGGHQATCPSIVSSPNARS